MAKKRLLTKLAIVLLAILLVFSSGFSIAYAAAPETENVQQGIVIVDNLNFRKEASTSSKVISVLPRGTNVTILDELDEWFKVKHENTTGYLFKSYVGTILSKGVSTATTLNVRSKPTTSSQSIDLLYQGTQVFILEEVNTESKTNPIWFKVSYKNGNIGFVSKKYVTVLTNSYGTYRKVGVTTPKLLNLRANHSTNSKILTRLREGSYVFILDEYATKDYYKKWYKVDYNGTVGWIAGTYLEEVEWQLKSSASTSSPSSSKNRNHNMSLACSTLTGTIVFPGETFSWIKTMGSCSANKGYLSATVYVNGKVSEGYGGGVCQVSTTFNMAIKKTGITTNATQHSLPVSYASRKDEASVSYPSVDFSFKNSLDVPILVEFVSNYGTVKCNIYIAE